MDCPTWCPREGGTRSRSLSAAAKRRYRQKLSTAGVIRFGDLDGDGLLDFVIFDPHNFDVPVRVGRNLGRLPGTRPALREQN
jgi:hypothetical protein